MSKNQAIKKKLRVEDIFKKYGIFILLLLAVILSSLASEFFFTKANLFNIIKQVSIVAIIVYGECMLIISGNIDLSLGAIIATGGIASVLIANITGSVIIGMVAGLGFGMAAGFINGFLITRYKLPSFMVTLGMQIFMRGLALQLTKAVAISPDSPSFKILGQGNIFGIPYLVVLVLFLCFVFWFIMHRTSYGRYIYAIGGNEDAAKASGVNVNKVKRITFMISGLMAGLAGFAASSRLNVGQPNLGTQGIAFEFDAIIGAVLGGASLMGGVGSVVGALVGVVFVGVLNNILNLLNVSAYLQQMVKGSLIIIAIVLDARGKGFGKKQIFRPLFRKAFGDKGGEM